MKRFTAVLSLSLLAGIAIAGVQSLDARIPAGGTIVATPSRKAASIPVEVRVNDAVPNSGTLTLTAIHLTAAGVPVTNAVATLQGTNGVYKIASAPYVLRGDRLLLTFSAVTNGTVTLISDIKE